MAKLDIRPLPLEICKDQEILLNEKPEKICADLEALKKWLDKQPHIIARREDQYLIGFLRARKYSLERTKEKLDMFYTIKTALPEFFGYFDPLDPTMHGILKLKHWVPLPKTSSDGSRIIIFKPFVYDPQHLHIQDLIKVSAMLGTYHLMYDDTSAIKGVTVVYDLTGMNIVHAAQLTPLILKKVVLLIQEGQPFRFKGIHCLNMPPFADRIFKFIYHFLSNELKKLIFIHNNLEDLYSKIPKRLLPRELKGNLCSVDDLHKSFLENVIAKREWLLEEINYKTDETKRMEPMKNRNLIFEMEGSFRKLEVD